MNDVSSVVRSKLQNKKKRNTHTHLVTPPTEEAHDRPFMQTFQAILYSPKCSYIAGSVKLAEFEVATEVIKEERLTH
jgi:hypothetical protein